MKILGIGNALLDVLLRLESDDTLVKMGMKKGAMDLIGEAQMRTIHQAQQGLKRDKAPGGSVCNTMRALARLGAEVGYVGKVGSDETGAYYERAVREAGVTPYFVHAEGISGCSTVLISPDGERTMATFLGPAATLSASEIADETLRAYDCVYIEGYLISNEALFLPVLQRIDKLGLKVALDLSNFNIVNGFRDLLQEVIPRYVRILFSNESEAEAYTGLPAGEAVQKISEQVDLSVVTVGKKGALVGSCEGVIAVPASGGNPVDTTGAGDNFAAGFLYGQSVNASLEQSARVGALLAGHVIETVGPQIPGDRWEQIKLKIKENIIRQP
ncbi:MAG: adenosine kinase [Tannerella sp.]|jgi:sugar/nucleoside kinase (ribokinase family)|nr:adenosine kinase [Tannerella sp.]